MRKKILLILVLVLSCMLVSASAFAERVDDDTHAVLDVLHTKQLEGNTYNLVKLSYLDGSTEALPFGFWSYKKDDQFGCFAFDDGNSYKAYEKKLRWLINNSVVNSNKTLSQLKNDINDLARHTRKVPSVSGNLSYEDAVLGAQEALYSLTSKSEGRGSHGGSPRNYMAVYCYYMYRFDSRGSMDAVTPPAPVVSLSYENDTTEDIEVARIGGKKYKVLPYTMSRAANGKLELDLSNAPSGSYVDDIEADSFNVYVPVSALPDATFASITVDGTLTDSATYDDICTYLAADKCGAVLLGEHAYEVVATVAFTHTHGWTIPAMFDYELTLIGKQSHDPVRNVRFTFTNNDGITINSSTDRDGKIQLLDVPCGDFFVIIDTDSASRAKLDTSVDDYGLYAAPGGISMNVARAGEYTRLLEMAELPASIRFYKYCALSREPLPYAVFGLFKEGESKPFVLATSDEDGKVEFGGLFPGNGSQYAIKETSEPIGYQGRFRDTIRLSRGEILEYGDRDCREAIAIRRSDDREDDECGAGIIWNRPIKVDIIVYVKDKVSLDPLEGTRVAVYRGDYTSTTIPASETPLVYADTDSNGKVVFSNLKFTPIKEYTMVHTQTLAGYDIDTTKHLLSLASIQTSTEIIYLDNPLRSIIEVEIDTQKADDYYDGYEFLLIGAPEYAGELQLRTGTIAALATSYPSLLPGTYRLHQVVAPAVYTEIGTVDLGISVTLPPDVTETIVIADEDLYQDGNITVQKVDDESEPLSGAVFNLYRGNEAQLILMDSAQLLEALLATGTTDSNGEIAFGQYRPGAYTVVEQSAPEGYLLGDQVAFDASFRAGSVVVGPVVNPGDPDPPTPTPSPTVTPNPTATLPPGVPATGEGGLLYVVAGILAMLGVMVFVFRKKIGSIFGRA